LAESDTTRSTESWTGGVCGAPVAGQLAATPERVTVEIVSDLEGIRALTPDYVHLYQVTGNALPYATQEWHLAWCEHLLSRAPHISQRPLFCVLRNDDGTCVAIMPLIFTHRRLGPLKVGTLALVGADASLTEMRNPLIEPGYERATVRALYERLATIPGWDWIQWNGVGGALAEALSLETSPQWYETLDDYELDLPAAWPQLLATLGRNMELHTLRAKMPFGPVHEDRFVSRLPRAFLFDVCERLAARDAVRVFQLRIADTVVASRIGFAIGDSLYLYHSGFDPAWARYAVMTTLMAEVVRYAIASGLSSVNLSLVGELSKLRWRPRRVDFYSALVHRDSVRSRLACGAFRLVVSGSSPRQRLLRRLLRARSDWN